MKSENTKRLFCLLIAVLVLTLSSTVCSARTIYTGSTLGNLHSEGLFNINDEENDSQPQIPSIFNDIKNAALITLLVFLFCMAIIGFIFIMRWKKKEGTESWTMILKKRSYRLDKTTYNYILYIGSVVMVVGVILLIAGYVLSLGEPLKIIGIVATFIGAYSAFMPFLGYKG